MSNACCDQAQASLDEISDDIDDESDDLQIAYTLAAAAQDWDLAEEISFHLASLDIQSALVSAESSGVSTGCGCCS